MLTGFCFKEHWPFYTVLEVPVLVSIRFKIFSDVHYRSLSPIGSKVNILFYFLPTSNTGHVRNPQTEAFLEFLDLPYLLDHASESVPGQARVALPGTCHSS